jgi:hypothetical protein
VRSSSRIHEWIEIERGRRPKRLSFFSTLKLYVSLLQIPPLYIGEGERSEARAGKVG